MPGPVDSRITYEKTCWQDPVTYLVVTLRLLHAHPVHSVLSGDNDNIKKQNQLFSQFKSGCIGLFVMYCVTYAL